VHAAEGRHDAQSRGHWTAESADILVYLKLLHAASTTEANRLVVERQDMDGTFDRDDQHACVHATNRPPSSVLPGESGFCAGGTCSRHTAGRMGGGLVRSIRLYFRDS
jgi:hypothetical protein